ERRRAAGTSCPGPPCSRGRCPSVRRLPPGREQCLGPGLEVDDPIVLAVDAVDVVLDQEPPSALVDLALVEVADLGKRAEGPGVLAVDDAAQHLVGHARAE